uniref:Uncharacterized protein n=1 Tax=Oryza glumipatula TaxID=40148 RepID=A0A0D9Z6Z3_9ORYZ
MWWWRPIATTAAALDEGFGNPMVENLAAELLSFGQKMAERAASHCRADTSVAYRSTVLLPSLHMAAVQSLTVLRRTRVKLRGAGGDDDSGEADGVVGLRSAWYVHLCSGTVKACSEPCIGKVVSRNGSPFILSSPSQLFVGKTTCSMGRLRSICHPHC